MSSPYTSTVTLWRSSVIYKENMMEGGAVLPGKLDIKWAIPKKNMFRRLFFHGEHKGKGHLASGICSTTSQSGMCCRVFKSLSASENQLRSLDSYFQKLNNDGTQPSSSSFWKTVELFDASDEFTAEKGLASVEDYLEKLNEDANTKKYMPSSSRGETCEPATSSYAKRDFESVEVQKLRTHMQFTDVAPKISNDDPSNFYLIGILASINIAVLLFEIASPIRNSEWQLFSLPLAYGAKINHLILIGEWWRLVTPMFLHSGVFHFALSCWMLLTFGPQVCRAYGTFTFFLIYVLGGLSGNLISFLHTPNPTVCGTGPVFAIIGAWLVYQIQDRDLVRDDATENMLWKAIIATCLSCTLSNFGPVDDWTHIGAAFTGLVYGFFTCPTVQMDDKSSETGREEGIRLVTRHADSCKSFVCFCIFILIWSSLLFVIEPPLNTLAGDDFGIGL
ncbi:hypothetical protein ACH5RR_011719 [Cinchona calisaya]|uniref:Peptidase S54 rhomboid domain-containing protein n=1 Tax=Cinchona calisaya TaxID=153742 RepID=A0ABD3A7A1_9GENT